MAAFRNNPPLPHPTPASVTVECILREIKANLHSSLSAALQNWSRANHANDDLGANHTSQDWSVRETEVTDGRLRREEGGGVRRRSTNSAITELKKKRAEKKRTSYFRLAALLWPPAFRFTSSSTQHATVRGAQQSHDCNYTHLTGNLIT